MHLGQEIYSFFNIYGNKGFIGIFIAVILMGVITYKTFKIILVYDISSYSEFINIIIPSKVGNKKIIMFIINNIVNIFLLSSFYIMTSGFATYFSQEIGILPIYGGLIICLLSYYAFCKNIDGIIKINEYLIPVLIFLIMLLGIKKINVFNIFIYTGKVNWALKSIFYASYNSIVLIPILISIKKFVLNLEQAKLISFISSFIILVLTVIIFYLISLYYVEIKNVQIPITYIASSISIYYKYMYGIVILTAIYTSAISAGYSFLNNCFKNKKAYKFVSFIVCFTAIFISFISFSNLVSVIYPIFGALGLIQIIFLLKP